MTGILEGEGTFVASPAAGRPPVVRVSMTDRDVVERVGHLFDRAVVELPPRKVHYKIPYATSIKGAASVELMRAARPWLGRARRAQIDRVLASWRDRPLRWRRAARHCGVAGCDRKGATRGLCRRHYKLWWKSQRQGRNPRYRPLDAPVEFANMHRSSECVLACRIAWLAGLLEGEGTFAIARFRRLAYPTIAVNMCARDVVEEAGRMLGAPSVITAKPREARWQATHVAKISGAHAAEWVRTLRPLMGRRRRAAIDAALAAYQPIYLVHPPATCIVDGCDAAHRARGLCHKHYMSWMRDTARGRTPRIRPLR